jgi:hypothetical protein
MKTKLEVLSSLIITVSFLALLGFHRYFPTTSILSSLAVALAMFAFVGTLIQDIAEIFLTSSVSKFSVFMSTLLLFLVLGNLDFFGEFPKEWTEWFFGLVSVVLIWIAIFAFETALSGIFKLADGDGLKGE